MLCWPRVSFVPSVGSIRLVLSFNFLHSDGGRRSSFEGRSGNPGQPTVDAKRDGNERPWPLKSFFFFLSIHVSASRDRNMCVHPCVSTSLSYSSSTWRAFLLARQQRQRVPRMHTGCPWSLSLSAARVRQQPDRAQHYTLRNERHHERHVAQAHHGHIGEVYEHRLVGFGSKKKRRTKGRKMRTPCLRERRSACGCSTLRPN